MPIIKILIFILLLNFCPVKAMANPILAIPEISAESAVALDVTSKRLLYSNNMHEKRPVASTTKIMTALLVLERGSLDDVVIISEKAASTGGSSIWLEKGERKTVEELLYGLILTSGNDAAVALAEHLAGDLETFALWMTNKAKKLGAENTSFKNPHGLDEDNHYSTAHDMALIAAYALNLPGFREVASTKEKSITWAGRSWDRKLINQNKLLDLFPGANGVKTGWTTPAGRCFVGSASKGKQDIVTVVLSAPDMWNDTVSLLEFAFDNYPLQTIISRNQSLVMASVEGKSREKLPVLAGNDFLYPLHEQEKKGIILNFLLQKEYRAPIYSGEKLGTLEIMLGKDKIGEIPLLAGATIERDSLISSFLHWFSKIVGRVKEVFRFG